jgi:hypothetical protein
LRHKTPRIRNPEFLSPKLIVINLPSVTRDYYSMPIAMADIIAREKVVSYQETINEHTNWPRQCPPYHL